MYTYVNEHLSKTWEKRRVKEYFRLGNKHIETIPNPNEVIFARALLGLPDKFEYGKRQIKIDHPKIERIASPIYFKPIVDYEKRSVEIYVLIKDDHVKPLEHNEVDFRFRLSGQSLNIPLKQTIDYSDMLNEFQYSFEEEKIGENIVNGFYPTDFRGRLILGKNNRVNLYII